MIEFDITTLYHLGCCFSLYVFFRVGYNPAIAMIITFTISYYKELMDPIFNYGDIIGNHVGVFLGMVFCYYFNKFFDRRGRW